MNTETEILVFAASQPLDLPGEVTTPLPTSLVWMPVGRHAITASTMDGAGFSGGVICDEQAARAVSASYAKSLAAGQRIWIDFNHDDGEAAAWVRGFSWDAGKGIIASVEWTAKGADALRGKAFYSFSPAFACERESGRIVGLLSNHAAGGLVNKPAFGAAMPALIAASAARITLPPTAADGPSATAEPTNMSNVTAPAAADAAAQVIAPATVQASAAPSVADFKAMIDGLNAKIDALKPAAPVAPVQAAAAPVVLISPGVSADSRSSITVKAQPFEAIKAMIAEKDSRKRGQIYCSDLRDFVSGTPHLDQVLAANSFGTVAADLVILRCLDLLKVKYPLLSKISTDFSAGVVPLQGQNIISRIISIPLVVTYNTTTGWANSDATTTDVPVAIGAPIGVQISLQNTELASSGRDLFAEQVEAAHSALGGNMVLALYAIITQANFSGASKRTIQALSGFARGTVIDMGTALGKRNAGTDKFLLLNSDYYGALSKDLVSVANPALIGGNTLQSRVLPRVQDFDIIEATNLPANAFTSTTGTLQGFGGGKDSLVIATRVPDDYTKALSGSSHGSVSVVTNPDTGISVQKVDFVDHVLARAYSRIALSYGVAKGQVASGQCLTET